MPDRHFTLAEARAALARLRPVAERMVELRAAQRAAGDRRTELAKHVAGNGGGLGPSEFAAVEAELSQVEAALAACVEQIIAEGVLVKDLDRGLLDFPARRGEDEVLLCWRVGEDELAWWHGVDEGFAGRKPLDAVE